MHKREFVSSNLHRIREKIGSGTRIPDDDAGYARIEDEPANEENKPANQSSEMDRTFKKALEKRREEFQRLKRDIAGKLTELLTNLPDEADDLRRRIELVNESEILFRDFSGKVESMDVPDAKDGTDYSPILADSMKTLENIRLEIIRQNSKMDKACKSGGHAGEHAGARSFVLELSSLSFKQLFRLGLYFYLPLLAAVGLCAAAVIAGAVILARAF